MLAPILAALPPTEYVGAVAFAIVAGAFAAASAGYPYFRKKKSCADITAFKDLEEARKGTTLQALADAQEDLRRLHELMAERDRLSSERDRQSSEIIRAKDDLIEAQMRELTALRTDSERTRQNVIEFAKDVLHQHGVIREENEAGR